MTETRRKSLDLDILNRKLVENIENVLKALGVYAYNKYNNRIAFACPIHGGDNTEACTIFLTPKGGTDLLGNWKCWTHNCQEGNCKLLNFIQLMLSQDGPVSFYETLLWANDITDKVIVSDLPEVQEYHLIGTKSRAEVRKNLEIPAKYYLDRGYSKEILDKYDIGTCKTRGKQMFLRVVAPVYDDNFRFVGCCGRTVQPKCPKCNLYHFENRDCPSNKIEKKWARKWMNSSGGWASHLFYNQWYATPHIYNTGTVILVEGAGDVWRLEEAGIHIGLGMFKTLTTSLQDNVLKKMPISNIILATDNDPAGIDGKQRIRNKLEEHYNIYEANFDGDIGDLTIEETKEIFNPILERVS